MSGFNEQSSALHFIIMGNSKEHIQKAIDHFKITDMVIFSSDELLDTNRPFIGDLRDKGIMIREIVSLKPFDTDSIRVMTVEMLRANSRYSPRCNIDIIVALTGGTNLMVVAMALVALLQGLKCHYVVKDCDQKIMEITMLEELNRLKTLDNINTYLLGDCQ